MRIFLILFLFSSIALLSQPADKFQVHAHRGFRALYPENTIVAFKEAVNKGAYAIELDIVISNDSQVVVSHEPWFNHRICSEPTGEKVKRFRQHNFLKLNYDSIKKYDCGKRGNKKFPEQKAMCACKPLLIDVIKEIEAYCEENKLPAMHYNIEIKSRKISDNKFHPKPDIIARLLMDVLNQFEIYDRIMIQSFDVRSLQAVQKINSQVRLGLLVANLKSVNKNIKKLGFKPYMYNPNVKLAKTKTVKKVHEQGVKVIVWTVNKDKDITRLKQIGVDGIISDFPYK